MNIIENTSKDYISLVFEKLTLSENAFEKLTFDKCEFHHCDFSYSHFKHCKFVDCEFVHCNLSALSVNNSSFSDVIFAESKVIGVNWTKASWPQFRLTSPIKFYQCNISQSSFFELSLIEVVIDSCKAHEVDFREADLSNAELAGTDFAGSLFVHTNLRGANFTDAINYDIDINLNEIKQAKFSFPEVISLLKHLEINIVGAGSDN